MILIKVQWDGCLYAAGMLERDVPLRGRILD